MTQPNFDHIKCPCCRDFAKLRDDHDYYGPTKPGQRQGETKYVYNAEITFQCYWEGEYRHHGTAAHRYPIKFCPVCGKPWEGPDEAVYS